MDKAQSPVAEQFDDLDQQQYAATLGMWTFLATEILFFGGLFLAYIVYRTTYPDAFVDASRHTLVLLGTFNTAILLTSSLTMALAVRAAQLQGKAAVILFLSMTILLGLCFLAVKGFEYREDWKEHLIRGRNFRWDLPPQAQIFWFLYWTMTGLHGLHVTVGLGLLSAIAWGVLRGRFSSSYYAPIEVVGLYWHFVDLVWIWLYPLLYLVHRSS